MRIFNFLLASDAVGGLGPPEDLINKGGKISPGMLIAALILFAIITIGVIFCFLYKNKGDE